MTKVKATAYHEAGHAVVGLWLGRQIEYIAIACDDSMGQYKPKVTGIRLKDGERFRRDFRICVRREFLHRQRMSAIMLAGILAQVRFVPESIPRKYLAAIRKSIIHVSGYRICDPLPSKVRKKLFGGASDLKKIYLILDDCSCDSANRHYIKWVESCVRTLIDHPPVARAIHALADEIMGNLDGRIEGRAATRIIQKAFREAEAPHAAIN